MTERDFIETAKLPITVDGIEYEVKVEGSFYITRVGHDADGNRSWEEKGVNSIAITHVDPQPSEETYWKLQDIIDDMSVDDFNWED